jgi:hypothetical protein
MKLVRSFTFINSSLLFPYYNFTSSIKAFLQEQEQWQTIFTIVENIV